MNVSWPDSESLKQSMIAYLVHYYRYRPRLQKPVVKLDVQTGDHLTADGFLEFPTEKQGLFTVAFEVTDATVAQELYYVLHHKLLAKDAIVFALLLTSMLYAGFSWYQPALLLKMGVLGGMVTFLGAMILLAALSMAIGYQLSRYRWIPALEQFKAYHAEEQWIAVGEGVFDEVHQTEWLELRKQCLYNGFGLVKFTHDFQQTTYLTPARQELFGGRRKRSFFFERTNPGLLASLNASAQFLPRELRLLRHQWAMMFGAVALCVFVYFQLHQSKPEQPISEMPWLQDSLLALQQTAIPEEETPDLEALKSIGTPGTDARVTPNKEKPKPVAPKSAKKNQEVFTPKGGSSTECKLPFKGSGTKYYVQEGIYSTRSQAAARVKQLAGSGVPAHMIPGNCLGVVKGSYIIYLGDFMDIEANARSWKQLIGNQLQSAGLLQENPVLKKYQAH